MTRAELVTVASRLLPAIAETAALRERERTPLTDLVRELADAGLGTWRVPAANGGPDAQVIDVVRFFIDLAAADPNLAQVLRSHFAFVETVRIEPDDSLRALWCERVLEGKVLAIASGEDGGPQGVVTTRVTRTGAG